MARDDDDSPSGAPEWMCTFSDMMSLLLCFFVLLFALSTIEKKKLIEASGSLRAAFGGLPAPFILETIPDKQTSPPNLSAPAQTERRQSYAREELRREEEHKVRSQNLQETIQVTGTEQGITFRLSGDVAFEPASSRLKAEGIIALNFIANELIQFPSNPVRVDGHTDNTSSKGDPNANWLLGAERAYTVMRYLIDQGNIYGQVEEKRFTYESFGPYKPVPEVDENTAIGRALNRRVEITLLQTDEGDGTYFRDSTVRDPRTRLSPVNSP